MKKYLFIILCCVCSCAASPAWALYYNGGDGTGFGFQQYTNGWIFTLASADAQTFNINDGITAISAITITQDAASNPITSANDIRITIPLGMNMLWYTTDTDAIIAGTASAKVSTTVTYEDAGKTLVVNVTSNFIDGDSITVSGLSFQTFSAASQALSLGIEIDNAGNIIARDYNIKQILISELSGIFAGGDGSGFGYYPGPWRGKFSGVTNPAKVYGISVWRLRSVAGAVVY
ncbi:MAG: hypothetical protein V2A70_04655 [Candidatus Omnitrophota bacterium]